MKKYLHKNKNQMNGGDTRHNEVKNIWKIVYSEERLEIYLIRI